MNMRIISLLLFLALIVAACGGAEQQPVPAASEHVTEDGEGGQSEAAEETESVATIQDGVQVIELEAGANGYVPGTIELQAGIPARFIVTRTVESACLEQIQIPDLGIAVTDLPLGEPVTIEFEPTEAGSFRFICGMNMQHGTLLVKREA